MRKIILLLTIQIIFLNAFSQKEYNKLDSYFKNAEYDKCIETAQKYIKKDAENYILPFFISKSYFEMFKLNVQKLKSNDLKNSLKYAYKVKRIDEKSEFEENYKKFFEDLYKTTLEFGGNIFISKDKDKSKPYFEYIAKIYNDTTTEYLYFYPKKIAEANVGLNVNIQKVNQTDTKGLKQGFWTKKYPNGVTAYEVYFKDNKPVGDYKRYHENGKLNAFLKYDSNSEFAQAKLYDENGELIAEGIYHGKLRDKEWIFYNKAKKISVETYIDGKKNGDSKTFYENGSVSEEKHWENDIENGVWRQFYDNEKLKLETRIDNGLRNSAYYTYYQNGKFEIKGKYINDIMEGVWIYYDVNGKIIQEIEYLNGKAKNQKELDEKEQEAFKKLEENRKRLKDPANFINDPEKYMKESGLR
ncbi:MAG: toxin-antitoxin system YwqK family antitoxin [Bacteroidales bacterium]|nr:toxin-antitoxin system YwqK family antitoxin [Bacteroidales bacterium]MBN2755629.1 toxin-antitoxin system YwqK family antitoxin [Bacteroidales bacterium]